VVKNGSYLVLFARSNKEMFLYVNQFFFTKDAKKVD